MTIKIGDRVRYLNSVGGGVVNRFINKEVVSVLEDDGFETPTLIRECVVVEDVNEKNNLPSKKTAAIAPAPQTPQLLKEEPTPIFDETLEGEELTVALAFVPQDVKKMQDTTFDFFLVNDSNYNLYYTISTVSENSAKVIEHGIVHLNTTLFLHEIKKEQLNDYEKMNVQFVAFKTEKNYNIKPAISLTLKTKPVNFYKLHSFVENDYFDEPAMIVPIMTKDRLELPLNISSDDFNLQQIIAQKERKPEPKPTPPKQNQIEAVEVDLHIHELLDNTSGMTSSEMLEYQMKKFREAIDEHKHKKGQRIVFIHGKGNGVLRIEIVKEIKKKYPAFRYQDASFKEYGFGATLIIVK